MCKSIAMLVIVSLLFDNCNAPSYDRNRQEETPTGTITNYQEQIQQQDKDTTINKKDSQERKQGLWIEDNGLKEVYYLNGLKNSVYKVYFAKTGKLEVLGWYQQDKPIGDWYYFDETSRLFMIEKPSGENKEIRVRNDEGAFILLPFKSYVKLYNKNGTIAKEGLALYDEDIQIEFYMYGDWKYYDETGKLIKEENFLQGKIAD